MAAYGKKGKGLTPKKARPGGARVTGIARALSNPGSKHRSARGTSALQRAEARGQQASGKPIAKYKGGPISNKATPNAYRPPNIPKGTRGSKSGAGKGGTSSSGKGASSGGSGSPTITKTVNTPAAPFLTAEQSGNRDSAIANLSQRVLDLTASLAPRQQATNTALQAAGLSHARSANQENQLAAARGVFQSSIHDNDLNDLDAALVERQNMLTSALRTFTDQVNTHIGFIQNTQIPGVNSQYNNMAVENAANVTPSTSTQTVPNPNYKPPTSTGGRTTSGGGSKSSTGKSPTLNTPKVGPGRIPGGTRPTGNISYKPAAQPRLNVGYHFTNPLQGRPRAGRGGRTGGRSGGSGISGPRV